MKLTNLLNENEGKRPLSNEVKKHFLEIVSTYNKYQEMMDRKSDLAEIAETLGGITEAAKTLAIHEGDDWFDKHTIKRNMSELDKLGSQFDKCATEAKSLDQRLNGLYEDMGHILSRYYKMGEITEDQMKQRLGMNESKDGGCGCGCGCGGSNLKEETLQEEPVMVSKRNDNGTITTRIKEEEEEEVNEDGKMQDGEQDPCWKGYEMVGMKKKNGKEVPNCVPKNETINKQLKSVVSELMDEINESLSVDPRKIYGGTGAKEGMVLVAQKGLAKILDLSKKNPSNVFLMSDDNYTNVGPYYVKNGKIAKYTVANPNYDLEKNKVRSLKVPSHAILKFKIVEGINESVNEANSREEYAAKEFWGGSKLGIQLHKIFKGRFDKSKFEKLLSDLLSKSKRPESTIKIYSRILGLNPNDYTSGEIIEDVEFVKDSTKKAEQLYKIFISSNESVNESVSRTAMEIGGLTGMNKNAIQQFVDKNELDIEKLFQYVKKGGLKQRMEFVSAIAGKPGNKIQKMIISKFKLGESVNEASAMSSSDKKSVYQKLKKGDKVKMQFGNSIRKGNEGMFVVSKGKTVVGKSRVERITLKNVKTPSGVKYYLYNRNNNISLAQGDMGAVINDMEIVNESVNEGVSVSDERHFGKKGIIIMIDDNGKKVSAIFKDKKNADKYNRNNSSDIKKLLDLAKKTSYPNAIDESVNEAKFGYKDSTASYINNHKDEYKVAEKMNKGNEMKFYDALEQMEVKLGHPKTMLFISNALRGYGVDMYKDPKIKNPADAQEALFLLSK